jgi:Protein of unknown function (DUF2752)
MRLICRPLAPRETDAELLWLTISIGAVALAALWRALHLPWSTCLFHVITRHPCPSCGATRAAIGFLHGNFAAAWNWNPLAVMTYCAIAMLNLYALVVLITGARRLRIVQVRPAEKKFLRATTIVVILGNWVYLLLANQSM